MILQIHPDSVVNALTKSGVTDIKTWQCPCTPGCPTYISYGTAVPPSNAILIRQDGTPAPTTNAVFFLLSQTFEGFTKHPWVWGTDSAEDFEKTLDVIVERDRRIGAFYRYLAELGFREAMLAEIAGLSELDQLAKIGEAVSDHFRTVDSEREKKIAERLNTKRSNISAGGGLDSSGAPGTGEAEDRGDDPAAEVAHRNAMRSRALRPSL